MGDKKGRGFCFADTAEKVCPRCGTELTPGEYFTAAKGPTIVTGQKTVWEGGSRRVTTTSLTQYGDIQAHRGAVCMYCHQKGVFVRELVCRILFWLGLPVTGLGGFLFFIQGIKATVAVLIGGIIMVILGWKLADGDGLIGIPSMPKKPKDGKSTLRVGDNYVDDYVSGIIVGHFPTEKLPPGRVALSRGKVKGMQSKRPL